MSNITKIYISLPMSGHEDTVNKRYWNAVDNVYEMFGEDTYISSPKNINDFTNDGYMGERDHDWAWYMAQDIEDLLRCDAIYMTRGFLNSKGCRTELAVARSLDLKVIYADDAYEVL